MNNYISVEVFIENDISGDWGKEFPDEKHKTKVFCVRGADINDLNIGKIENLPVRYVKEASKDKFLEKGNIIIEISGGSPTQSTGRVAFLENIDREVVCSNFCRALKIKKEYSPKYVFYLLQNIYNSGVFFYFESKTSGIKNLLYNSAFENIKVPNRDYSSQQKIENVITVIDKKIQLLHQINDNLSELAKTIYDYWFVQFDFPDENGKLYKSSGGKMVYNEVLKREIPEGWEVKRIGEFIDLERGVTYTKENISEKSFQNIGVLRATNISGNKIDLNNLVYISNKLKDSQILKQFDTLIVMSSGSKEHIGKNGIYYFSEQNAFGAFCAKIRAKEKMVFEFINVFLQSESFKIYIKNQCLGTNINNLNNTHILLCPILKPADNILELYHYNTKNIFQKIAYNTQQIQHFRSLRDWLLPMLMNGQISVE